jgi:hypothetical protein
MKRKHRTRAEQRRHDSRRATELAVAWLRGQGRHEDAVKLSIENAKQAFRRVGWAWPVLDDIDKRRAQVRADKWVKGCRSWAQIVEDIYARGPQKVEVDGRELIMGIDSRNNRIILVDPEAMAASVIMGQPSPAATQKPHRPEPMG